MPGFARVRRAPLVAAIVTVTLVLVMGVTTGEQRQAVDTDGFAGRTERHPLRSRSASEDDSSASSSPTDRSGPAPSSAEPDTNASSTTSAPPTTPAPTTAPTSGTPTPSADHVPPAPAPPSTIDPPVVASASEQGFALWSWTATGYGSPEAAAALDSLVDLGADTVAFVPRWFVDDLHADRIVADPTATADLGALRTGIAAARARGLAVTVRPLIDVRTGAWRGDIAPRDRTAWFTSYRTIVRELAAMSAELGVEQLVVGTELYALSSDAPRWREVIADVRARFAGTVTYAALPFEWSRITFWDALDVIGINAWSPLADQATTDVGRLTEAWEEELDRYEGATRRWRKPVLLTEAGFTSQHGTATAPWRWDLSTRYAPDEQAAGYAALLAAMADEDWLIGVHWWAWRANDRAEPLDFTPQDTPAATVVRDAWR